MRWLTLSLEATVSVSGSSGQVRHQDLAAGGEKPKRGSKNQQGGHIFKIQYWMYAAIGELNVKCGGTNFNGPASGQPIYLKNAGLLVEI